MTHDPFADRNDVHRKMVDSPWQTPPRRNNFRHVHGRPLHRNANNDDALLVRAGRAILGWRHRWIIDVLAMLALGWFVFRLIYAAVAWHWN